ncbi:hypothetical protein DID88_009326 [Monilinia fructigena]|uniref:FAD/NAD(P)-binding domain-containing protein n=1 Tax=Monilinia fructigena TaxID=38457 RepID=A0A395IFD7_9HELO|nr:hypothetical protein DID88_009326 [Monilinia fructigena]
MNCMIATSKKISRSLLLRGGRVSLAISSSQRLKLRSSGSRSISTSELDASKGDRERVLILGSGWSGFTLSRQLDPKKYQTVVISPRSYFVFTPLLASTAVGTLEFRSALESVRGRGRWRGWGLTGGGWGGWGARGNGVEFWQGWADDVNFDRKTIKVEEMLLNDLKMRATWERRLERGGCLRLGMISWWENALFLKDIGDARKIRKRILECFETAALPTTSDEIKKQLLNFAIVGGGPTGVEFAAELFDLCHEDLSTLYPSLIPFINITIYDVAPKILPISATLAASASVKNVITEKPEEKKWELKRKPENWWFDAAAAEALEQTQQEATMNDVFALGDVAVLGNVALPATAQVANQEAKWLGKKLNGLGKGEKIGGGKGFTFRNMGVMTYVGGMKAIMQTDGKGEIKGRTAWLIWRGAYLTQNH